MTRYFFEEECEQVQKQRKNCLIFYFVLAGIYTVIMVGCFLWYLTFPYGATDTYKVRLVLYPVSVAFLAFSFIYLGIKFRRVNAYYKTCKNMCSGIKEDNCAVFDHYDEEISVKDRVDYKSLVFLQWNKYKKEIFERKVLVFNEKPFPQLEEGKKYDFVTQGNVLIEYEQTSEQGE